MLFGRSFRNKQPLEFKKCYFVSAVAPIPANPELGRPEFLISRLRAAAVMMLTSGQTRHSIDTVNVLGGILGCFQHRTRVVDAVENRVGTGGRESKQK
jgi:hypothetical protein